MFVKKFSPGLGEKNHESITIQGAAIFTEQILTKPVSFLTQDERLLFKALLVE